jgi:predicted O-methyltransferase YrrM
MNDQVQLNPPAVVAAIQEETLAARFPMASDAQTGALLRTLVCSKPGGTMLELGTGTGLSTAWLLDGMDGMATLLSVDSDSAVQAIARRHLGHDSRLTLRSEDGGALIQDLTAAGARFDFIFADTWPGKYYFLEETLLLVKPGGFYIVDDMLPQPNWPEGHAEKAAALVATLESHPALLAAKLDWATGLIVAVRKA